MQDGSIMNRRLHSYQHPERIYTFIQRDSRVERVRFKLIILLNVNTEPYLSLPYL